MTVFGARSMTDPLRRVLVRAPQAADAERWREYGWRSEPDPSAAAAEHEAFRDILRRAGAEVILASGEAGNPDAIYAYDPLLVGDEGAVLLRPGKDARLREPASLEADLKRAGVPVAARVEPPGTVDGGDTLWLDHGTLLVGRGYRTNASGVEQLRAAFPDAAVLSFDLPHWNGRSEVMHLMSLISPLADDLALVYPRLAPVRLLELLAERGIATVEVPDEEFETMGPNVLALAPRRALALEGNDETLRRLEAAGVEVLTYKGDEISRKGDGGPTCLTRPLLRVAA